MIYTVFVQMKTQFEEFKFCQECKWVPRKISDILWGYSQHLTPHYSFNMLRLRFLRFAKWSEQPTVEDSFWSICFQRNLYIWPIILKQYFKKDIVLSLTNHEFLGFDFLFKQA